MKVRLYQNIRYNGESHKKGTIVIVPTGEEETFRTLGEVLDDSQSVDLGSKVKKQRSYPAEYDGVLNLIKDISELKLSNYTKKSVEALAKAQTEAEKKITGKDRLKVKDIKEIEASLEEGITNLKELKK